MDGEDERDVPARLTRQIDENLRRVYGGSAEGAVPDKFLDLIEQLRQGSGAENAPGAPSEIPERSMAGARR